MLEQLTYGGADGGRVVPETNYTFDALIRAQVLGDFMVLKQRRRRVFRINLGEDNAGGLTRLTEAVQSEQR